MATVQAILAPYLPRPADGASAAHPMILVFSASWAKPHNERVLKGLHDLVAKHATASVLFVSAELDQVRFTEHVEWLASWAEVLPYHCQDERVTLFRHFEVDSVPQIRVIEGATLRPLTPETLPHCSPDGRALLQALLAPRAAPPPADDTRLLQEMRRNANVMYDEGDFHGAACVFSDVLALDPCCIKSNFNLAVILHTMGQTRLAIPYMLRVIEVDPNDATAHSVLRSVFFTQEPDLVRRGYASIVATHPTHLRAAHTLAALQGDATTSEKAYVRQVFDELADTFEEKLVQHLHYKVPWQLLDAVTATTSMMSSGGNWRVLDLGCGTGLCGRLFRPFVGHTIGVDLSPLMVDKTIALGGYDEVYADDILPVLDAQPTGSVNLVLSADVWIYVGALETVFAACHRVLGPFGTLAFSIEELEPSASEFKLVQSGRFQHTRAYIRRLATATGFSLRHEEPIVVRQESSEPIRGVLYVLAVAST
ncbi:hypothetical protein SPRG_02833 [Saprolegnia parasitica CBS 223.65]|uniref:Methyltransferase type 11 domain-containing protein n=1 Tax=Saprolegnia parasitica (strain CBS 223.65) TaxID=695850 RepID=A0A067CSY1_SAPPC|nr:hypothetical protein SPRG_02833 [Saprolegnia parasitica CBS 223.65]KDO32355.1 hypothetical protein SPRG_02833 [Saprolegnia parasitica CBS 223.65]|eukprot:XP_012196810.1 hypothetical protein SPRG_02833 [Saprolegnia parasitica CBS 223.65]